MIISHEINALYVTYPDQERALQQNQPGSHLKKSNMVGEQTVPNANSDTKMVWREVAKLRKRRCKQLCYRIAHHFDSRVIADFC